MPIQRIKRNGSYGYRWGTSGKVYATKAQALRQARAIEASKSKQKKGR